MVTNLCAAISAVLLLAGTLDAYGDVLWSSKNCNPSGDDVTVVRGKVTDAICCGTSFMAVAHNKCKLLDKNQCNSEDTCKWHVPYRRGQMTVGMPKCLLNRDRKNNVCCKDPAVDKLDNCVDMMAGRCPSAWQVPGDCCPAPDNKYAHMLTTDPARGDLVCCNAPCTAIEKAWRGQEGNLTAGIPPVPGKAHCTADGAVMPQAVRENCAPGKKGYMQQMLGGLGGAGGMGLDPSMLSQLMGMPVGQSVDLGKVIPSMAGGTGMNGGATLAALQGMGFGSSKDSHVQEITVDDFFDAIIEALDNDKDVFEYNKEVNSDAWFGKQSFGGLVDGFKFINPMKFINRIYGSPFGLANAQAMYGMQYGIPMNKFKQHTGNHHMMTGFANPYGPPPPQHYSAPPTPPPYAPPVYPQQPPTAPVEPVAEPIPEPHPEPSYPPPHYPAQPAYPPYPQPYPEPHYAPYPEPQPVHYPSPPQPEPYPEPYPAYQQPYPEPQYPQEPHYPQPEPHYPQPEPHYPQEIPQPHYPQPEPHYQPQPEPHYPHPEPHYPQPHAYPADPYYPQQPYPQPYPEPQYAPYPHPQPEPHYPPPQDYYSYQQAPYAPPPPAYGPPAYPPPPPAQHPTQPPAQQPQPVASSPDEASS